MRRTLPAILCLLFAMAGCAGVKPKELPAPPGRVPSAIRAQGTVEFKRTIPISGRALVIAKSPASFRIEVFGPFGQTVALLSSDGETTYLLTEKGLEEFKRGDAGVPYHLAPEDITAILLGNPKAGSEVLSGAEVRRDEAGHIISVSKVSPGRDDLNVYLDDYRAVSGVLIPYIITIENGKRKIEISHKAVEVDPDVDDTVFKPSTSVLEEVK
ncbi:MAG TPA: hypothetical protein VII64_12375 [Thermodesulfobacteriota bacterium]